MIGPGDDEFSLTESIFLHAHAREGVRVQPHGVDAIAERAIQKLEERIKDYAESHPAEWEETQRQVEVAQQLKAAGL